tara:strand:- start:250 stop:504 length:255 start_codon:yes stop_codon:yes gene_type:complete
MGYVNNAKRILTQYRKTPMQKGAYIVTHLMIPFWGIIALDAAKDTTQGFQRDKALLGIAAAYLAYTQVAAARSMTKHWYMRERK